MHSYTLECGYHAAKFIHPIVNLKEKYSDLNFHHTEVENFEAPMYNDGPPDFNPQILENVGKALLVSILDILEKNPISRIPFTEHETLKDMRSDLADKIRNYNRFHKDEQIA